MEHVIRFRNVHGNTTIRLRGPAEGFSLSPSQAMRWIRALCGMRDCSCGGSFRYGEGYADGSARIDGDGFSREVVREAKEAICAGRGTELDRFVARAGPACDGPYRLVPAGPDRALSSGEAAANVFAEALCANVHALLTTEGAK